MFNDGTILEMNTSIIMVLFMYSEVSVEERGGGREREIEKEILQFFIVITRDHI